MAKWLQGRNYSMDATKMYLSDLGVLPYPESSAPKLVGLFTNKSATGLMKRKDYLPLAGVDAAIDDLIKRHTFIDNASYLVSGSDPQSGVYEWEKGSKEFVIDNAVKNAGDISKLIFAPAYDLYGREKLEATKIRGYIGVWIPKQH
jgi:hypothetical protein